MLRFYLIRPRRPVFVLGHYTPVCSERGVFNDRRRKARFIFDSRNGEPSLSVHTGYSCISFTQRVSLALQPVCHESRRAQRPVTAARRQFILS